MPTFSDLEAQGAVIGEIHVRTQDIFDLEDPRESAWFYRLANKLHINTRPEVIRRSLLFKPGDKVSARLIEETARQLRAAHYLYDVSIVPIAYSDGVVDLEVRTRDSWSLDLGVSGSRAGGHNTGRVSVREENLLGTAITIGVSYSSDVDRTGTTFQAADSNIMGSRIAVSYAFNRNDDGHSQVLAVGRPFYELDARWGAGLAVTDSDGLSSIYNSGENISEYRHLRQGFDVFGGWSPGLINGWTRRYSLGYLFQDDDFRLEPSKPVPERLPDDLTLSGPYLRFELIQDAFRKDTNLNLIGRIEDLTMGIVGAIQVGYAFEAFGSTRDLWLYNGNLSNGFDITKDSFVLTSVSAAGRYGDGGGENQVVTGSARYYLRNGRHLVYYAAASAAAYYNPDRPGPLQLGGDNGLRGYPLGYQSGERSALLTLEARAYSDWYPFRLFRVGGAVFYDTGRAWHGENTNTENPGWLRDVGFGLRLLSARSSKGNVVHADFAFPLDPDPNIKKAQFLVKTRVSY